MVFATLSNLAAVMSAVQIPQNGGDGRPMVVFMGIAAISRLVLALLAMATAFAVMTIGLKAKRSFGETAREMKGHAYPLIEKSTGLVSDLAPSSEA